MLKRILSRAIPEHEWPVWILPATLFAAILSCSLLVSFIYFGPGLDIIRGASYLPSSSSDRVRVEVGGTLFAIPAHYTRSRQARRAGLMEHIDLQALGPELVPYRQDLAADFLSTDETSALIIISLRSGTDALPERRRFDAIYKPYLRGTGTVDDNGLQVFTFKQDGPYAGKQLFRGLPLGAREKRLAPPLLLCDAPDMAGAQCESRFALGGTAQVSYRFKRHILPQWEELDANIRALIRNFRAAARTSE